MKKNNILIKLNNLIKSYINRIIDDEEDILLDTTIKSSSESDDIYNNAILINRPFDDNYYAYISSTYNEYADIIGYGLIIVKNNKEILEDIGYFNCYIESKSISSIKTFHEIRAAIKAIELAIINDFSSICIVYNNYPLENFLTGKWKSNNLQNDIYESIIQLYSYRINISYKKIDVNSNHIWIDKTNELSKKAANM